VLYPFVIKGV